MVCEAWREPHSRQLHPYPQCQPARQNSTCPQEGLCRVQCVSRLALRRPTAAWAGPSAPSTNPIPAIWMRGCNPDECPVMVVTADELTTGSAGAGDGRAGRAGG